MYCLKQIARTPQHMRRFHWKESRVKNILGIEAKKERDWAWRKLTREGDFCFSETMVTNENDRVLTRRPALIKTSRKYITCQFCFGRIRSSYRKRHLLICLRSERVQNENKNISFKGFTEEGNDDVSDK